MDYGEKIRTLRKRKKLSAEKLGKLIGFSQSMVSKLENGERNIDIHILEKICTALGLTLAEFFADQAPELPPEIRRLVDLANRLTPKQREILIAAAEEWAGLNQKGE